MFQVARWLLPNGTPASGFGCWERLKESRSEVPRQDFTKSAPSDLLQIIRSGGENILDRRNGYMFLKGDRAQVSLRIALFRERESAPASGHCLGKPERA